MDDKTEQLRSILRLSNDVKEEQIIQAAEMMLENIELVLTSTTDPEVRRIAGNKKEMLLKNMPEKTENTESNGAINLRDVNSQSSVRRLLRTRLSKDKILSEDDVKNLRNQIRGDDTAEADYIRAVLSMKIADEIGTLQTALKELKKAYGHIQNACRKEPGNHLYQDYYESLKQILDNEEKRQEALKCAEITRQAALKKERETRQRQERQEAELRRRRQEEENMKQTMLTIGGIVAGAIALGCMCSCCQGICHSCGCT